MGAEEALQLAIAASDQGIEPSSRSFRPRDCIRGYRLGMLCDAPGCTEDTDVRLCPRHEGRLDLADLSQLRHSLSVSDAEGDLVEAEAVVASSCPLCSSLVSDVDVHVLVAHRSPRTEPLGKQTGPRPVETHRGACGRCGTGTDGRRRRCGPCRDAVRGSGETPPAGRWRPLTNGEVAELRSAKGTELDSLVRGLQAQRVSSSAIGKALGLSPQWMSRRYPRPTLLQTRRLKG